MVFADTFTNADTKFNGADINQYREEVYEATTPITMENLGRKFKYASTTKFKIQKSRKINKMTKTIDNIISIGVQVNGKLRGTIEITQVEDD